ncbi:hypothetical protein Ddc_22280 [Ditylenchus destructor]|nr:hypothetical protein Ddc_22280 [Ditylenchus destructor]
MMLSFLVTVALMSAMVLSIGKAPANANAEGHHITELDRYLEITQDLGDAWTKQLMVIDFSEGCKVAAQNMQKLADEITTHNDKNLERMKKKARISLSQIETLKSDWN